MERICQDCGKSFDGRAGNQFCSDACYNRMQSGQKPVISSVLTRGEVGSIPPGMVLVDGQELAELRAKVRQAECELGPEIQIDYSKLTSYLADAKQYVRERHPAHFARSPFDIDRMLDEIFGKGHKGKLPSMTFTVNVNLIKSALTPDWFQPLDETPKSQIIIFSLAIDSPSQPYCGNLQGNLLFPTLAFGILVKYEQYIESFIAWWLT